MKRGAKVYAMLPREEFARDMEKEKPTETLRKEIQTRFNLFKAMTERMKYLYQYAKIQADYAQYFTQRIRSATDGGSMSLEAIVEDLHRLTVLHEEETRLLAESLADHYQVTQKFIQDAEGLLKHVLTAVAEPRDGAQG